MISRISIVSPEFNHDKILHQPWRQIYAMAKRWRDMGIPTTIATSGVDTEEIGGIPIINLNQPQIRTLTKESRRKIMDFSPDVIYWVGNPYSGIYLRNSEFDVPVVLHISTLHMLYHELKALTPREILTEHRLQLLTAFFPFSRVVSYLNNPSISGIISSSTAITQRLVKLGVRNSKIKTSPLFFESDFNPDVLSPLSSKNEGVPLYPLSWTDDLTICYAGPSNTIRGSRIILETIKILKERGIKTNLLFLLRSRNPVAEKREFERIVKQMQISERVQIVTGILTRAEMVEYFSKSDIIVIPTKFVWNEPPLTILEAMSLGKPVLTTTVCGIPEMVSGNAVTLYPRPKNFAKTIEELANDRKWMIELGSLGMKYVQSLPNWDALAKWTFSVLGDFEKN